jgi:hypothetical protein
MNNRIVTNINNEQLSEIIMEEIMQLDDTEIEKYVESMIAELFHSYC